MPLAEDPRAAPSEADGPPAGLTVASFSEGYRKFFELVPATSDQLRWHNYHLRHEVYARELGWEPIRTDEIETDRYDAHSLHCLIRAVTTHSFVGGARLVCADPEHPGTPLPFEVVCRHSLYRDIADPAEMDRSRIAEISRLAVVRQYRRRRGEAGTAFGINDDFGKSPRIRLPYLTLGLYLALISLARWHRIDTLFMLTEPVLAKSISHLGVEVRQIGEETEHRGHRFPSMMDVGRIIDGMAPYVRPFFDTIDDEIVRALKAAGQSRRI